MGTEKTVLSAGRVVVTAVMLGAAIMGCSGGTGTGRTQRSGGTGITGPGVAASVALEPLPTSTVRRLPHGTFYLLWGPVGAEENLWEVTASGQERQLSHNPRGYEIDSFAASRAGIVVSDALYNADLLARWTSHGADWLRPWHAPGPSVRGFAPDIRPDGEITYLTPSNAIWVRQSFAGPARIIYRYPPNFAPGSPTFGPGGQVALVVGPSLAKGQKPGVLIIFRNGIVRTLRTGFSRLGGQPTVWGQNAPALVIPPLRGAEELFFPGGRRELLPEGWRALCWSPDGTQLLVVSATSLGVWSLSNGRIGVIGPVNRSSEVWQASWLSVPARM